MLCNKCKKNPASFYYKQTVNGYTEELALCSECAKESETEFPKLFSDDLIFSGMFDNLFGNQISLNHRKEKSCQLCGSVFSDIASRGKVGCAKCYETFKNELATTVRRIHGSVNHIGKKPIKKD